MMKIYRAILLLGLLWSSLAVAEMNPDFDTEFPSESIGIDILAYPELDVVPGYPVYYAPRLDFNYFFYDGLYWLYQDDTWYTGSWYDGPWWMVDPEDVPVYILRIPVRYYNQPPVYFGGWMPDAPPRWGDFWGPDWEEHRRGWDRWNRHAVPPPAPLPLYQRHYSGARYPRFLEQQREIERQRYRYRPYDPGIRRHWRNGVYDPRFRPHQRDDGDFQRFSPDFPQQGGMNFQNPSGQFFQPGMDEQDSQGMDNTGRKQKKQKQDQDQMQMQDMQQDKFRK